MGRNSAVRPRFAQHRVASHSINGGARTVVLAAIFLAVLFSSDCKSPVRGQSSTQAPVTSTIDEVWKKSQSLRPRQSTDTTPVTVKVGDVTYKIPPTTSQCISIFHS
jgi:hypothetical protein